MHCCHLEAWKITQSPVSVIFIYLCRGIILFQMDGYYFLTYFQDFCIQPLKLLWAQKYSIVFHDFDYFNCEQRLFVLCLFVRYTFVGFCCWIIYQNPLYPISSLEKDQQKNHRWADIIWHRNSTDMVVVSVTTRLRVVHYPEISIQERFCGQTLTVDGGLDDS